MLNMTQFMPQLNRLNQNSRTYTRAEMIELALKNGEALLSKNGALVQWTPPESTGRSPQDTYIVDHPEIHDHIDWTASNNIPISINLSIDLFSEALKSLENHSCLITHRVIGADSRYALPVITYTDSAVSALFTENMFRPVPGDIDKSIFEKTPFHLIALPRQPLPEHLKPLRKDGKKSNLVMFMDFHRKMGLVWGSSYLGSIKKLMFTVMNYILPQNGILPLHASANEGPRGDLALFLGLSGTGKTTLSADPERALLGDDEHGWSEHGIANFENGCYAKLVNLDPAKEPEIHHAITHTEVPEKQGAIVENTMMYPDGTFDFFDIRLTENSRGSYPLTSLSNIKPSSVGGIPTTIIFLTADANGVLPPVAKLTTNQAMLWFLMGYTSKLAGTEAGIKEPVSTFSRFFGAPFMPRNPQDYSNMLGEKLQKHKTQVFLVNTGWSGGPYGEGLRINLGTTRTIIRAVLNGTANALAYQEDARFHVMIPASFPGIDSQILDPSKTWKDRTAYEKRADRLAHEFSQNFQKNYGKQNLSKEIIACCPQAIHPNG
jgi:phosphoenolpyruvate carboxykinase (ATP)